MLNVSFGFSTLDRNSYEAGYFVKLPTMLMGGGLNHFTNSGKSIITSQLHNFGSVSKISTEGLYSRSQLAGVEFSELSHSVTSLYEKLDEGNTGAVMEFDLCRKYSESLKLDSDPSPELEFNDTEFDVVDRGVEVKTEKCDSSVIEIIDVADIFKEEDTTFDNYLEWNLKLDMDNHDEHQCAMDGCEHRQNNTCISEPAFEELDSAFYDMLTTKPVELDSLLDMSKYYELEDHMKSESTCKAENFMKSITMVDVAGSIENEFLNMLSTDPWQDDMVSRTCHDLPGDLTQFENKIPSWANSILDTYVTTEQESGSFTPSQYRKVAFEDDFDLSFSSQAVERNHYGTNQSLRSRRNAKILENLETEALMHEWGLNEKAFQYSPRTRSSQFGSPVYLPAEEPLKLPSIEDGLGLIIWTKDGGLLRSMNPLLFRNAKNGARLIVQISAPIVLPAAMGFTNMEIFQCWASTGVEKMCIQANELMPMEDVTGKKMQDALSEAAEARSNALHRWALQWESRVDLESSVEKKPAKYLPLVQNSDTSYSCTNSEQTESDYVSFEDLVPMAVTNIEGLLVEGLKIQSGMPDQEAPSELSSSFSSERASSLQVVDVNELVKSSLSLQEWVKLDSGELYVEDETEENILKLFAAHCMKPIEPESGWPTREDEELKLLGRSCGNNFRMGFRVQLRDPLRNYEMVGSSMLALFEVERVYSSNMILDFEQNQNKIYEPLFKFSEVHLAGLNVLQGDKNFWGTSRQQQSGSRWLLSSGIAKPNKNLSFNSVPVISFNSIPVTKSSSRLMRKALAGDALWSISLPIQDKAATWDEQVALNVHVRNPDIIFPTEFVK